MINSNGSERGWRGGRRIAVLASTAALAAVLGVMVFGGATASAALVNCGGTIQPKEKGKPSVDAKYAIQCNADYRAFSMITTKQFDFFGTELIVYAGGQVSSESSLLQCEGPVPGSGFGCGITNRATAANKVTAGNVVTGDIGFPKSPCKFKPTSGPLKVWITVTNEPIVAPQGAATTIGSYSSEPFRLKVKGYGASACASAKSVPTHNKKQPQ